MGEEFAAQVVLSGFEADRAHHEVEPGSPAEPAPPFDELVRIEYGNLDWLQPANVEGAFLDFFIKGVVHEIQLATMLLPGVIGRTGRRDSRGCGRTCR